MNEQMINTAVAQCGHDSSQKNDRTELEENRRRK